MLSTTISPLRLTLHYLALKSFENTLKNICQLLTDFQFILLCFSFRSLDLHIREGYIFHINLRHEHNHRLFCADALRKRDVSSATTETLRMLFQSGHSPSSALDTLKYDLQEQKSDNYIYATADLSICPDLQFCYRLETCRNTKPKICFL